MNHRLFGIETEYALTGLDRHGSPVDRIEVLEWMMDLLHEKMPCIADTSGHGVFLANGARLYIDAPDHPEVTTPECADPWDAVRYVRAGEKILTMLAEELPRRHRRQLAEVVVLRSNVDLSGAGTAWGTHESYLHRGPLESLPAQIIPHLVSRLIYTGAGGFDSRPFRGVSFTLSPRVPHLEREISEQSTHARGIFHTKNESLSSNGYHRLHLLCGESLCSETSAWLKVGTTALVVALIDAGLWPGNAVELQDPLAAMRAFAADPTLSVKARTCDGRELSAIEVQRHYLQTAEAHLDGDFMPRWSADVCRVWRDVLDRLEQAPDSLDTVLDWRIKLALFRHRATRRGIAWESLSHWSHVVTQLSAAVERRGEPETTSVDRMLDPQGPSAGDVRRLTPYVREHELEWSKWRDFVALRQELFEVDMRYGQLGSKSVFDALDRSAVLSHRIGNLGSIDEAVRNPPAVGRAAIRGRYVRELNGDFGRYVCDWNAIYDRGQGRMLDLQNPFATEAAWRPWNLGQRLSRFVTDEVQF
jgi:proteasome accessory factor A